MKTKKDLKIKKGAYSAITDSYVFVPKGSQVKRRETISGTEGKRIEYFVSPSAVTNALDKHDAEYYGLRVNESDIEF